MAIPAPRPIVNACRLWLRPVARWLLKSGVTWKEFAEISRSVFIAVAEEEFGLRGRPTNVSRIALLTGLTRRDVRRYREEAVQSAADPRAETDLNHATRVLSGWHLDPEYIDELGRPRALPAEGEVSMASLVRRYAGDIPPTAITKELLRSGSIAKDDDGSCRALRRFYMPHAMDSRAVERAGHVISDLATTVEYNLSRDPSRPSRFEGRAQNHRIDPRHLPAYRAFMEREGQAFLERVDEWLSAHESATDDAKAPRLRVGVGVYAINEELAGEKS